MFKLTWKECSEGIFEVLTYKGQQISILREQITSRGGGIEIDLTSLGFEEEKMTAYQNYLGGGMLGAVQSDCTFLHHSFVDEEKAKEIEAIQEDLKRFFCDLTAPGSDYTANQCLPASAY